MHIIKIPSVYSCHLPGGEWLNFAQVRRLFVEEMIPAVIIEFENGDRQTYTGDKAIALLEAWKEAQTIDKSRQSSIRHYNG